MILFITAAIVLALTLILALKTYFDEKAVERLCDEYEVTKCINLLESDLCG